MAIIFDGIPYVNFQSSLLPMIHRASRSEMELETARRPGLIPVAFKSVQGEVIWLDLNEFHCSEGFFHESLTLYSQRYGDQREWFISPFDALFSPVVAGEYLQPSGFIFHAGRCGSTVLAKSLARSRRNLMFSEAAAHNQIWEVLPAVCAARAMMSPGDAYRALILAMGRKRLASYSAHLIKFTSYNIVQIGLIREAFPDVPALFLFREPGEVLESYRRGAPGWLTADLGYGMKWPSAEAAVDAFFRAALSIEDSHFRCLDYRHLTPRMLPSILKYFGMEFAEDELAQMSEEFAWDAKSGLQPKPFVSPVRNIPRAPGGLEDLYEQLKVALAPHVDSLSHAPEADAAAGVIECRGQKRLF